MDIEELLRSRKFEKLDLTKDLTDLEYEQLFNALDQDPNLPKIVYGDGGGIRILCQSEDRRHNSECFCEGFLIYETVCSSKDSAHYIGNRLSGYWCSITSSWQGCHEERIKRAKALREKEAKVPTRYDKFKALVESNETSWDEVAKFTHEANFAINESDATPEVLSISQIRRKGSWSGALWDKYHWIKAFWYLLRFDRVEDKVPAGTKYIGITSEKKIVYKDSESNVLTEPFTLKLVETTSWKSILTFKKTMLDTIRSKNILEMPLNSLSTRDLLLYLSAMEDLEDINTIGECLEELEVTFPGCAPSRNHRNISVEDYEALLHEGCNAWNMLVADRTPRAFFNGDQYTDITYYLRNRALVYKSVLRSISFNLTTKTVTFVYKDRTSFSMSMSDFKNRPFPVTPESQEQTQNTPETPMATQNSTDQNIVNLLAQARRDGRRMAVRTGARELVLTVRDPLAAALANALGPGDADVQRKVALFMSGPLGEALVGAVASAGLHVVNGKLITKATQMEIANEVADELKIEAGAKVMGIFTGMVMVPVRDIMVGTINSIAAKEDQPQIAPPMETPAVGLGSGSNEKIVEPIEECVAEKIEVKK